MPTVISVEHLSKTYRLGQIGTGTFANDLNLWWAKLRGKPNPLLRIGEKDHGNRDGEELWALRDVSFTVEQGEVLGIIGRNGAGKSTLLKILSRVTAPTSGKLKVKGRIASLLEVGTGFHPELTGRENIYLNGAILGMSKNEVTRKFDEIVDFSEVEKFIDTPVKRYSSGMYVRLAFAVAAHLEPEILIVDEVLAVGDAEFQKKCLGKMGDVASEGRTVLFVSHNMGAIQRLCHECILLQSGKLAIQGNTTYVVQKYLDLSSHVEQISPSLTDGRDYEVGIQILNGDGEITRMWHYGDTLSLVITINSKVAIYRPAVDIAFYNGKVRLFALQSDLLGDSPKMLEGRSIISFNIENPGFTCTEMHFDLGIRQGKSPYFLLIREAGRLSPDYSSIPQIALTDCILYPKVSQSWEI